MAEGLAFTASVIAVIQISEQVVSACYQYFRSAKDAKQEILDVINVVGSLKTTSDNLRLLANDPAILPNVHGLINPLNACKLTLEKIAQQLGIEAGPSVDLENIKVGLSKRLVWPWKGREVGKLLEVIERHKTIFILALSGDTLPMTLAIKDGVTEVMESVRTIAINQRHTEMKEEKNKILGWLKSSDPSTNHSAARKKHEPTTGDWFLQSETFSAWTQGAVESVWLHGVPGAGKTILCSTIIESLKKLCTAKNGHRLAYFYFDFGEANKRTVNGMVRSMITHLCTGIDELYDQVVNLYKQYGEGTQQPENESLVETLILLMECNDRTYLILDALDECKEQEELLRIISRLIGDSLSHIDLRVLVTCRKEKGIMDELEHLIDIDIDLAHTGIYHDIKLHVIKCLEYDKGLRKWPYAIQMEIRDALLRGASGM